MKRQWHITAVADHGIYLDTKVEADTAIAAMEAGMASVRAAVAPDEPPDFWRIEVKELKA
jgi:hypothetical protein